MTASSTEHGLQKGGMALIDEQQAETLYKASGPGLETSGGSVANTMVGVAQLGGRTGFIGRVRGMTSSASIFCHDIRAVGARFETPSRHHRCHHRTLPHLCDA